MGSRGASFVLSVIPLRDPKGNGRSSQCSKRRALIHRLGREFPSYLGERERKVGVVCVKIFAEVPYLHLYYDTGCWDEES